MGDASEIDERRDRQLRRARGTTRAHSDMVSFLQAVLDATKDAVFGVDLDGTVTSWNRSAERIFGVGEAEVVGNRIVCLFPYCVHAAVESFLSMVTAGDHIDSFEVDIIRRGGMPTAIALTLCPVVDSTGTVTAAAAVVRDLTEQRLAQATLAESAVRLNEREARSHVGTWVWDIASDTVQWTEEMHRLHDLDPLDFGGELSSYLQCIVQRDRTRIEASLWRAVASSSVLDTEYDVAWQSGAVHQLRIHADPVFDADGRVTAMRGTVEDVSNGA